MSVGAPAIGQAQDEMGRQCLFLAVQGLRGDDLEPRSMERFGGSGGRASTKPVLLEAAAPTVNVPRFSPVLTAGTASGFRRQQLIWDVALAAMSSIGNSAKIFSIFRS